MNEQLEEEKSAATANNTAHKNTFLAEIERLAVLQDCGTASQCGKRIGGSQSQGALRDSGLRSDTPSAMKARNERVGCVERSRRADGALRTECHTAFQRQFVVRRLRATHHLRRGSVLHAPYGKTRHGGQYPVNVK